MNCPLCENIDNKHFTVKGKKYFQCHKCGLTYLDAEFRLPPEEEQKRYSYHQNSIDNQGYVNFLNRIIEPALQFIPINNIGLDYGCGPNPVLSQILNNKGIKCSCYDPFFFPKVSLSNSYDFIFATECFEHFFSPKIEIEKISKLLVTNGILCIMTELASESTDFANWYYKNDPTHVCFYEQQTINYICNEYNFTEIYNDQKRTIILQKTCR